MKSGASAVLDGGAVRAASRSPPSGGRPRWVRSIRWSWGTLVPSA